MTKISKSRIDLEGARLDGASKVTFSDASSLGTANSLGSRNKIINGGMKVDQRNVGASQVITSGAALAYTVDRFYAYCTGANVTGQRVAGSLQTQYRYQFTGAAGVTKIGFAQRIEQANSYDLAGTTATLSVDLSNSLLTTVTWVASYANSADTFGTLASPTVTQIATGTLTVSNTITRYALNITIPSAATKGIQIEFSVTTQTSGTFTVGNVQLEQGTVATPFEQRSIGVEMQLCKRYYRSQAVYWQGQSPGMGPGQGWTWYFEMPMRVVPTVTGTNIVSGGGLNIVGPQTIHGCGMYAVGNGNGAVELTTTAVAEL